MKDGKMLTKSVAVIMKAMELLIADKEPESELIQELHKMQIIVEDRADEIK